MPEQIFSLDGADLPWGDYGRILHDGMSCHQPRDRGLIRLERTGPKISPITFPGIGNIVVTDGFRKQIEGSGLSGFTFKPVIKYRIVELDWEDWDFSSHEPAEYPASGEPEDYIMEHPHPESTAAKLGPLWEMVLQIGVEVKRWESGHKTRIELIPQTWNGADLFTARTTRLNCLSEKARVWFNRHFADYVTIRTLLPARG